MGDIFDKNGNPLTLVKIASFEGQQYIMPSRVSEGSAAYDVYVPCHYKLQYGRQCIPLGWCCEMPKSLSLTIRPRSGYSLKGIKAYDVNGHEVRLQADVMIGLVDSDYRGGVGVLLNVTDIRVKHATYYLGFGQAIAQMSFANVPNTCLEAVTGINSNTERGTHGFGQHNNE